ncbi:DoxX family protein [Elizabethkingia anophelis]|nr:DoxX family protein [Elizabethkingia anophelis]MDV3576180.1 DoxX family protein [Elizabethkingia anophelis]MDV3601341.1 DoxX family protein [Elizabethkingia anophelis]MDV3608594.1 DoxX family protein [Elizabethkingia anophelis]MDV3640453.1 DoxX family protein [Elizabethkingia anophelis]
MRDIVLLLVRLVMSYGFISPSLMKFNDFSSNTEWFKSIGIPFPMLSTALSGTVELMGVFLLGLGLFTRYISYPLIITMLVAIFSVHLSSGFSAMNGGFEINLYYIVMLLTLIAYGPGKYSLDYVRSDVKLWKV